MIYCLEDDKSIQGMMVYSLKASGFDAKGLEDGKALWNALENEIPSLIMLDLNLPGEDGISILKKIRANERFQEIPVIIATARGTEYDKVIGLDDGADDYLCKPFGMMEMISRVKAVLRRCAPKEGKRTSFEIGRLSLDEKAHCAYLDGSPLKLTGREYELLRLLISNADILFSREEIFRTIWGQEKSEESRTVDVHIGTLRTKLGPCSQYIQTVRGIGYRFLEV